MHKKRLATTFLRTHGCGREGEERGREETKEGNKCPLPPFPVSATVIIRVNITLEHLVEDL